jgi:hypothetical protein
VGCTNQIPVAVWVDYDNAGYCHRTLDDDAIIGGGQDPSPAIQTRTLVDRAGTAAFVTIHPSFLLRIREAADKEREYRNFVRDLQRARKLVSTERSA